MKKSLRSLTEGAIMVALAVILSFIPLYQAPLGGKVTFVATLPLCIYIYRSGVKNGFLAAFVFSIFQFILGLENLSYGTSFVSVAAIVLFDYIIAYTIFGVVAFFGKHGGENKRIKSALMLSLGTLIACVLRFLCHMVSGAVVWYSLTREWYADDPSHVVFSVSEWGYSFIYNMSYMLPETVVTVAAAFIVATFLNFKAPNLRYASLRKGE